MEVAFEQVISRGCGIDVHKKTVVATINGESLKRSTREFGTFTSSLTELKTGYRKTASRTLQWKARAFTGNPFITC